MTVAQGTPRTDEALAKVIAYNDKINAQSKLPGGVMINLAEYPADGWVIARQFERELAALSAQVVELQQQIVHSSVTRASVPPSVSDGGTTAAVIAYIDGFYVSGNSVPIDRPWINAESWGIAKELLALGLPLEHALIEQECVYRRKLRAYGNETRAKSPLQERLGMINTRTATKIEVPNE